MTIEEALIAAVVAEAGAIVFMFKYFLDQNRKCASENHDLNDRIGTLENELGIKDGTLRVMERCPIAACPYRAAMRKTQQLQ